ncbi:MAG TPA: nickel pincer cofactor biosynthesis protein LarC [Lacipirellulaceae bacterium]|nr:nickel pincer cofactor biosynthesis protein LarC [Lacipirellulaceae bacterium]
MRIAYLDCASGISGDMTLGALVDAGAELAAIQTGIDSLGLPSCRLVRTEVKKQGFRATQITVEYEPEHKHRHLHHITAMIDSSTLTARQKELAGRIFHKLAEAEAKVHGSTIEKVHFHEVGAVDSIADIVGAAIGFDLLGIERIVCSPVPTGHGYVQIAHGRCSIPAPATGELLRNVPLATLDCEGELTTPTGAAIVAALADDFGSLPALTVDRIGYGAGQKDFPQANILRILIGAVASATGSSASQNPNHNPHVESIVVLETNLDNATGETIGHAVDLLWQAGALDVSLTSVLMKKGRPGIVLSAQCRPADVEKLERVLFAETATLGVRHSVVTRTVLARETCEVSTHWGKVAGKVAYLPDGSVRFMPEYEACHKIATAHHVALSAVIAATRSAWQGSQAGLDL